MGLSIAFLLWTHLIAAVPFGVVITTLFGGDVDLRAAGSGNIGATNVARVYGRRLAGAVLAFDLGKGLVPVLVASALWPERGLAWGAAVAAAAWTGHCFSVFLEFRGGKGVATGAGALLGLAPLPTSLAAGVWALTLAFTGRSSVAALTSALALVGFAAWLAPPVLWVAGGLALGTIATHLANIKRLAAGEEAEVVRPVRWGRSGGEAAGAAALLAEGPGGARPAPLWREAVPDPLAPTAELAEPEDPPPAR
jgi:glycerol-3-phosphate acyltransferase PlsY